MFLCPFSEGTAFSLEESCSHGTFLCLTQQSHTCLLATGSAAHTAAGHAMLPRPRDTPVSPAVPPCGTPACFLSCHNRLWSLPDSSIPRARPSPWDVSAPGLWAFLPCCSAGGCITALWA